MSHLTYLKRKQAAEARRLRLALAEFIADPTGLEEFEQAGAILDAIRTLGGKEAVRRLTEDVGA